MVPEPTASALALQIWDWWLDCTTARVDSGVWFAAVPRRSLLAGVRIWHLGARWLLGLHGGSGLAQRASLGQSVAGSHQNIMRSF